MTENLLHYFKPEQLAEVHERFQAELEYHQEKVKELERKLAVIAMEMERRNE